MKGAIERAGAGEPLALEHAIAIAEAGRVPGAFEAARAVRDRQWGSAVTFSPKVFLPLTNLCRNFCDYCTFRRSPGQPGAWTMTPAEVASYVDRAAAEGCVEALFCLGDTPESAFPTYAETLASFGQASTVAYLHRAGQMALARGLLPHTNAGILTGEQMASLAEVNVSLGLMLESVSERLCGPRMPHHRAPDKHPRVRIAMIEEAGRLRIPFTTGILIGIGETPRERAESLVAIRDLHRRFGHVQEVIVQGFRAHAGTAMRSADDVDDAVIADTVALARLVLDADVSVQAPPNLSPGGTAGLVRAGVNDLGGISPVTPDFINPKHPWPHLERLADELEALGHPLRPRLPVYDAYVERPGFLRPGLVATARAAAARLATVRRPADLARQGRAAESEPRATV